MDLTPWLSEMVQKSASDLFITQGLPPILKVEGHFFPLKEEPLTQEKIEGLLFSIMSEIEIKKFQKRKELNFAIQKEGLGRFRVSAYQQRLQKAAVFRRIENKIPTLEELKLPLCLKDLALKNRGLILIVGGTGTGKSSTLAAMIGHRNSTLPGHVLTVEEPIEYLHEHNKCIISQREIGIDTESYGVALKNSLRQAPDVILIGEIRTKEVMQYALAFAETGHLCLATLHANNANQALDRIASFFDLTMLNQLWMDLSLNLKAIVAQQLIPRKEGMGRIPAVEILVNTPVISDHIRKGDVDALKEYIKKGEQEAMQTFDQSLYKLYSEGKITQESALKFADSENEVRLMIKLAKGNKDSSNPDLRML